MQLPPSTRMSSSTVRRRLSQQFGLRAYRPAKKPLLSKKNIRDRLNFCRKYESYTPEDWNKVLFSDETNVYLFHSTAPYIRRPASQRYNKRYCVRTVKHPEYCMVWASFSARGRGNLFFLPKSTTMNGKTYLNMLKEKLEPMMDIHNCEIFQHDGAPCHRSKIVNDWLHQKNIQLLGPWPGQSPDLNPIENLFSVMKTKVSRMKSPNLNQLRQDISRVWCTEISPQMCENLVHSMPRRIRAVLENKGHPTRF